jgi:DNA-binding beta-propeller fold protein YncE
MAISYVSYSSVNGGGNVGNVLNAPAGAVAGNLIVAFSSNISGAALTPPAGWTTIHSDTVSYLGWHIYAAGETSYTFTGTYGYQYYITGFCLSGNAPTSPVDVGACSTYSIVSGGSSITTPSVTTTLANDFVVSVWQADMYINPPTALVPQSPVVADLTSGPTSDGFNGLLAIGHVTQAAAGASPTQTAIVTCSSSVETICATLALFANSTPLAPTLVSPIGGVYANLASTPTFVWTGNFPDGTLQRDYAFRMKISGAGSYSYWNATTPGWQSTIVWNVGGAGSLTFPASSFTNGNTYNWSVATESTASIQGPFATDAVVVAQVAPVVTVTGPTGTVTSSSPLVTWTSTLGGSAVQIAYQVRTFTSAQYGAGGFSPGTSTASDDSGVVVSTYPFSIVATSLTNGAYRSYVQVTGTGPEQSAWAYTGYTVTKDEPATPTITATATTDGATGCPVIALTASCNNNILSAEDASFEPVGSALAVGSLPQSIAIDPAGAFAYTANYGASTVTKINLATFLTVGSALAVGSLPQSIAIDPAGAFAYTANYGASTVTKINLATFLTVGSALAVGSDPYSIAIDPAGAYAYVANAGDSTVTKINLSTFLTVGSALAVGSDPYAIAIDPAGTFAYVANAGDSTVTKINLSTFLTVGSALAVGSVPQSIAVDPAGTFAYVANAGDSTVTKINLSTFLTVGSALAVGSDPQSIAIGPIPYLPAGGAPTGIPPSYVINQAALIRASVF